MPRPVKPRSIAFKPNNTYFAPKNEYCPKSDLVILKFEELEAMRLKDLKNLNQEECAKEMNVSRQTFQIIIDKAREKVTNALINGSAINIQGGNYILKSCDKKCKKYDNDSNNLSEENKYCSICNK
ncbi:DUF134 domain-containing protein [Mycoplasmatota bacterium WC44]